ncbi:hypothetical protein IWQ56_004719 [Coemansia nantahalensis]|nr:hypothetical protein IWQ56_004719 [Coemansia nantahalensis]
MQVLLMDESGKIAQRYIKDQAAAAMAGSMVSPLYALRDMSMEQGAYFVYGDLSVRVEGVFRLRFDLFEICGDTVYNRASTMSDPFTVYSPKRFPGMMESTPLSRMFADQGLRIRIRTEAGTKKRGKKGADDHPAKRARCSPGDSIPPSAECLPGFAGPGLPMYPAPGVSRAPPAPHPAAGLLVLGGKPYPVYGDNKENMPPHASQAADFGSLLMPGMGGAALVTPCLRSDHPPGVLRAETTLDLDDIAAVALLDSLSSGVHGRSNASVGSVPAFAQQQQHHFRQPMASPIYRGGYTPAASRDSEATVSPLSPAAQIRPLPGLADTLDFVSGTLGKPMGMFGHVSGFGAGAGIPLSNYRLSAVRGSDSQPSASRHNPPAMYAAPRHSSLNFDMRPGFGSPTWDLLARHHSRADSGGYDAGTNSAAGMGSHIGSTSGPAMPMSLALPPLGILGSSQPSYEQWDGVLPALSTQLAPARHPPSTHLGFPRDTRVGRTSPLC